MQGDDNETFPRELSDQQEKDQAKSQSQSTIGANPSELEGCLKVIYDAHSTGNFDDIVEMDFMKPLMDSPAPAKLQFFDQTTPEPRVDPPDSAFASTKPSEQGQLPTSKDSGCTETSTNNKYLLLCNSIQSSTIQLENTQRISRNQLSNPPRR